MAMIWARSYAGCVKGIVLQQRRLKCCAAYKSVVRSARGPE